MKTEPKILTVKQKIKKFHRLLDKSLELAQTHCGHDELVEKSYKATQKLEDFVESEFGAQEK